MSKQRTTELHNLSKDELLDLILQLTEKIEQLSQTVKTLQAEVAGLKTPPPNSGNSSQPPSRDQKVNRPEPAKPQPRGARPGHTKMARPWVEKPDQVIPARVTHCPCGADLSEAQPWRVIRRQLTELPECQSVVIETRQVEVECPGCGPVQGGLLPAGLEATRQLVVDLQHQQHLSYARMQTMLQEVFQIDLSQGGQACIIERAGQAAQPVAETIREQVRQSATIGSDETSARVDGRNGWEWVFRSGAGVYHVIRPSRGEAVLAEIMGDARPPLQRWSISWASPFCLFLLRTREQLPGKNSLSSATTRKHNSGCTTRQTRAQSRPGSRSNSLVITYAVAGTRSVSGRAVEAGGFLRRRLTTPRSWFSGADKYLMGSVASPRR